jgi:flagellin
MRIQHNIMAMNAYRNYNTNTSALSKNLEKLSSGYRINRAGDDAAGLAISEKMRAQISGLDQASSNVKDGISLVQTAEGALQEVQDMMNRMVTLATESANGTYQDDVDRDALQSEVDALKSEINRIADSANFNGINLLDGSLGGGSTSANGATFTGAEVAKYTEANFSTTSFGTVKFSTVVTNVIDTFNIDGQTLTIDWSKGDAKLLADNIKNVTGAPGTAATKDWAKKLEDFFNDAMQEQGLSGSVNVTSSGDGKLKIESNNKTASSEVSFIGTNNSDATKSVGSILFETSAKNAASSINKATQTYNGDTFAATDKFIMKINGVEVNVTTGTAATKGSTTMSAVATALTTAIQTAAGNYNTALGLTAGAKDSTSGLTGLTTTDFTVEVDDGSFVVKYEGDQDVNFSFKDVGERTVASSLGLSGGSSQAGGNRGLKLQIGDTSDSYNQMTVSINNMHTTTLGIDSIDISNQASAGEAISIIKNAINQVSSTRGDLGAIQNRLEHTSNNLSVMTENIQDAESTIRDTDIADEMTAYTKNQILIQSAQAMLAQANSVPQGVLQLLQ